MRTKWALARGALAHDVAFERRAFALGTPERGLDLLAIVLAILGVEIVVVALVVLARDRLFELAHTRAELAAKAGQALGTENQERDHQHDDQLGCTDVGHCDSPQD